MSRLVLNHTESLKNQPQRESPEKLAMKAINESDYDRMIREKVLRQQNNRSSATLHEGSSPIKTLTKTNIEPPRPPVSPERLYQQSKFQVSDYQAARVQQNKSEYRDYLDNQIQ